MFSRQVSCTNTALRKTPRCGETNVSAIRNLIKRWAGPPWVRIPAGGRDFSVFQKLYTCSGAHPVSYSIGTEGLLPGVPTATYGLVQLTSTD